MHVIFVSETGLSVEQREKDEDGRNPASDIISSETLEISANVSRKESKSELSFTEQRGADARVISPTPEVLSSEPLETANDTRIDRKLSLRTEMDTYEEITKSEVASLDDWENVHKSCLSEIPPVDPEILKDLELRANDIAGNLDHMLATLANSLKAMSHVSVECLGAYSACVDHVSETVDVNIKSMYTLIARCEELNVSLKPVQHMAEQVKEIKKTLDIFEAICK